MAFEDAVEECVVGSERKKPQGGVGEWQSAARFEVECGGHRIPFPRVDEMSSWKVNPG